MTRTNSPGVLFPANVTAKISGDCIISSTTLGPEVRHRLVSGIIESPMERSTDQGPVSKVAGHDATAYNAGMVHIAGSRF